MLSPRDWFLTDTLAEEGRESASEEKKREKEDKRAEQPPHSLHLFFDRCPLRRRKKGGEKKRKFAYRIRKKGMRIET